MSRKIIGVTVGTTLPKPNFKQTDPTKGDYIRNKPDFDGLKGRVDTVSDLVGDTSVSEQINKAISGIEIPDKIYVQNDAPTDVEDGALWLDMDEDHLEDDKVELKEFIIDELAKRGQLKPEFANSMEECTDTTKLYVLPDGYIYAYIGKEVESNDTPNFTNQLPISEDLNSTEPFNGTGYITGNYLTTTSPFYKSGALTEWVTGYIPYTVNTPIYIKGISSFAASHDRIYFFTDKTTWANPVISGTDVGTYFTIEKLDNEYYKFTPNNSSTFPDTVKYIRFSFTTGSPTTTIITLNEAITYSGTVSMFTNQLPISTDTDGSVYNGQGYKTDTYLSNGNPGTRSGVETTGFIPIGFGSSQSASGEQVIYLSGVDAKANDGNCRMAFYNASKGYILQFGANQFATGGSYNIPMGITTDTSGNFSSIDITAISAYFHEHEGQDIAYFRICTTDINADSIITVNQPITYTSTEGGIVYAWENTGHAFVPADYEDRILALEAENEKLNKDIEDLKNADNSASVDANAVPDKVIAEATALVDKALSRSGNRILRFLISADAHQKNDHELITKGTKELGQAHGEVLKQIGVDFVANLGDVSWGASSSDNATVVEECRTFNRLMLEHIRGQKQIWTEGNHETGMLTDSQIHGFIYSHNKDLVQDADHWIEGYGYIDFPNQRVRVICLNTDQSTGNDSSGVSDTQLKWFAEVALNMEGKTHWNVITMGHHPLGYNNVTLFKNCVSVVEAFIGKKNFTFTTNGGTQIAIDYSNKSCQYVAHFHGHAHSYSMVKMQKYVSADNYQVLTPFEICIPNACYERNNQYQNNGDYSQRYSTETTYYKSDVDGKRTSFNLVTICLDEKKIYADNYGAGIDRVISY